ncbi:AN1-type zinc finger domain-containing protein [Methanosarcina sp.]|uniref:AN1-type zinc finger domain-containing protein n=1 Tax=Methanosarcina sp. TaxID=2213 RepID=UPI00345CA726
MKCQCCGEQIEIMAFKCKRCGELFCVDCRLPEIHDCSVVIVQKWEIFAVNRKKLTT